MKLARRLFIRDQLVMGEETKVEFGTTTSAFGKVRTRVERKVMSSTTPSMSGVEIQSSTWKGLSSRMTSPPNRFWAVSCAASAMVKPPSPMPVMRVATLMPVSLSTAMPAIIRISTLAAFFSRVISVLFRRFSSSSCLPNGWNRLSEAQSHRRSSTMEIRTITAMR